MSWSAGWCNMPGNERPACPWRSHRSRQLHRPDLRLIDSEMSKLAVYAGDRQVTQDDVRLLVPYAQDANIFDMVDALGHRRTAQAFRLLAQLRNEGAHPLYLLTMIVRQYRILVQVKDLMEQGLDLDNISRRIKLHSLPDQKSDGASSAILVSTAQKHLRSFVGHRCRHQNRSDGSKSGARHPCGRTRPRLIVVVPRFFIC